MNISELKSVVSKLCGVSVPRPMGTLAGHAAGLPFELLVHKELASAFDGRTYRQYELLNEVFLANPRSVSAEERVALLGPESLQYLLKRGRNAMMQWSQNTPFEEKQNDTAETVILPTARLEVKPSASSPTLLVDVKTQDSSKKAQPPNIISAEKVAHACRIALESESFLPFDIVYVGIRWTANSTQLNCTETAVVSLTKIPPKSIYINWVAAQQIQFHPFDVDNSFGKPGIEWAREYIDTFCDQLERRIIKERVKLNLFKKVL